MRRRYDTPFTLLQAALATPFAAGKNRMIMRFYTLNLNSTMSPSCMT